MINSKEVIQSNEGVSEVWAISPDNHWLAGRSTLGRFGLWNTGKPGSDPIILPDILNAAFSSDGSQFIFLEPDQSINLWAVEEDKLMATACQMAGRNFTLQEWAGYFGAEPYRTNCPNFPSAPPQSTPTGDIPSFSFPTLDITPNPTP